MLRQRTRDSYLLMMFLLLLALTLGYSFSFAPFAGLVTLAEVIMITFLNLQR